MATQDGRRVNRPYRKASEYLTTKQATYNGPRTITALENENAELREKLTNTVRRMENMEVEFEQSREYFSAQLDITTDKLNRTTQTLKLLQRSYSELQSINYELEQRILKVSQLENEKCVLTSDIHELTNKLTDARSALGKTQKENERLRKDCNLAVQLLQCNEGNFKQQKANELPRDLQHRVEEYRMDISQYNEYINPYTIDSDDENGMPVREVNDGIRRENESVPIELLAKVLQKPENIHLNMDETDYIRDPELNSMYKGQIAEKKLIKYDYDSVDPPSVQKSATVQRSSNNNNKQKIPQSSSGGQSSSPWEMAPTVPSSESSGSPWEMSTDGHINVDDTDDYGSASAYGAYPVSYRRPRPPPGPTMYNFSSGSPQKEVPTVKKSTYNRTKMSATYSKVTSPKTQKPKGTGENEDVYISQTYQQQQDVGANVHPGGQSSEGSNVSSRKSTPAKVPVDNERGSNAEKSSLLDQEGSEEEDMVMTIEVGGRGPAIMGGGSPKRVYKGNNIGAEGKGLLNQDDSDKEIDERDLDEEEEKGNVREYEEEEGDLREVEEEGDVREPTKHEVPEFNLLNLDDNAEITSPETSPAHIMMQQLLHDLESPVTDLLSGTTLLPELPPPSGFSEPMYDGELITESELLAPPPPDMYSEILDTPTTHPEVTDQSLINIQNEVEETVSDERMKSTTSLDDLQVFTGLEINKKHKNDATSPDTPPLENIEMPSSGENDSIIEEIVDNQNINTLMTSDAQSTDDINIESEKNETESGEMVNYTEEREESGIVSDSSPSSAESISNENNISQYKESEVIVSEINETEPIIEDVINANAGVVYDVTTEVQIQDIGNTGEWDKINGNIEADCQSSSVASDDNTNIETQENEESNAGIGVEVEPLEVLDLQKEPRGGTYNRRRRNSFDQAREYGSVMDD